MEACMRPFHIHGRPGGPRRHTQTGRSARPLGAALRLLPIGTLLAWQLTAAVPAQARAGDLDPSFGTGGKVVTDIAGQLDEALAVAVQANGKIVAAGRADESDVSALGDFALVRYRADGTLDPSFGTGGKVKLDFTGEGGNDVVNALAVQANGRLVAAGYASSNLWALARFRQDGTLDPSFGTGGKVTTALGGQVRALAVQADGKLVAAGAAGSQFALARYLPDGTLDAGFGTGGVVTTDFPGVFFAGANALAIQPDGKLVAAGHAATAAFALARYKTDGTLDAGFGTGGIVTTAFGGFFNQANALVVQDNGKLVAAGQNFGETSDFAVARYRANGTLDAGFGLGGKVTTGFPGGATAAGLVVQADGRLVAAGTADPGTGTGRDFALVRYRPNGSLDPSFGAGGKVTTDFGANGLDRANALAVQADGRLVAAGSPNNNFGFGSDFGLARYLAG
jgi:uncharacterized delta-60 repeat protein